MPSLKGFGLHIKNDDWVKNKTKDNPVQLHILNRSLTHTIDIKKKPMYWFYFFIR